MEPVNLTAIVGVILALSIASERLVEIIKNLIPFLNVKNADAHVEGWRCAILQTLAVASGIISAFLAQDYIPAEMSKITGHWSVIGLGLLASGGSGFWNSILSYLTQIKELKKTDVTNNSNKGLVIVTSENG